MLLACGGTHHTTFESPAPTGAAARDAALLQGRVLYTEHCARCHGISGEGGTGPSFVGGKLLRDFPTVDAQRVFIHKRSIGTTLSTAQLDAVIRYEREVLALRKQP
jgi:mono/diheme cytochrome c family protein